MKDLKHVCFFYLIVKIKIIYLSIPDIDRHTFFLDRTSFHIGFKQDLFR